MRCEIRFQLNMHVLRMIAGLFADFGRPVTLLAGGRTNATGNSAVRGGAAALVDTLIVQQGHSLAAQRNTAQRHGGAFALLSGANLKLIETDICPTRCLSSLGNGVCENACLRASCNWDGGDCVKQGAPGSLQAAGSEAGQVCDRHSIDGCRIYDQTIPNYLLRNWYQHGADPWEFVIGIESKKAEHWEHPAAWVDGCHPACFTAACDWSRELCVEPRSNVRSCPLIDAVAYSSIKMAQR